MELGHCTISKTGVLVRLEGERRPRGEAWKEGERGKETER